MSLAVSFILCGVLVSGCAARTSSSPTAQAALAQTGQPKPKRPFMASMFSWMGTIPSLLPRKPKPPQAQVPRLIGVIKTVSREDRFVLIDAITFQSAQSGDILVCIKDQKQTATLRMSPLKNPPFLIADIASGNPSPGDRVLKP